MPQVLTLALTAPRPIVIDADAIGLVGEPERLHGHDTILTPHEGEFVKLFGEIDGSKAERALEAARRSQSVIVYKGPDTLVAAPDGRLGFAPPAPAWLASAGTGDVLAGMIAAMRARGHGGVRSGLRRRLAARPRRRGCRAGDDRRRSGRAPSRRRCPMSEPIVRIAARGDGVTRQRPPYRRSRFPATCCSTTARSSRARTTRRRHAATFPSAAAASCSI